MVFSIFIIVFIGIIAYFHFVQGFFSATLSAMFTVLAAATAISYHETVVGMLLKGKMADDAHSMVLCMIFAVVYIVLRTIFDAAIPGNVRTPSTVDKVGAALMGIVAGIFCTGIFAIAAQMLPFDPAIGFMGAEKFAVRDNPSVTVPTHGSWLDSKIFEEMEDSTMTPDKQKSLLVPVDSLVMNTAYWLSNGSLSSDRTLASVHPDYLNELFGERLGIQTSARRVALQYAGNKAVDVVDVYSVPELMAVDGELPQMRVTGYKPVFNTPSKNSPAKVEPGKKDEKPIPVYDVKPGPGERIIVVRIKINNGATDDEDRLFRFSCGSIHMVGKLHDGTYKDFYPIGTLQNAKLLMLDKLDDFLFVEEDKEVDLVFMVDESLLVGGNKDNQMAPDTMITVKRFANLDLAGMDVKEKIKAEADVADIRNPILIENLTKQGILGPAPAASVTAENNQTPPTPIPTPVTPTPTPTPTPDVTPTPTPTPTAVQTLPGKDIAQSIKATIDTGILATNFRGIGISADASGTAANTPVAGGTVSFKAGSITAATIAPTATLIKLGDGTSSLTQLFCPSDKVMVQITVHPYTPGWDWITMFPQTKLQDTNANSYPVYGIYALGKIADSQGLFLRFDSENYTFDASLPDGAADGDYYFVFFVPKDTDVKTLKVGGKTQDLDSPVHTQ